MSSRHGSEKTVEWIWPPIWHRHWIWHPGQVVPLCCLRQASDVSKIRPRISSWKMYGHFNRARLLRHTTVRLIHPGTYTTKYTVLVQTVCLGTTCKIVQFQKCIAIQISTKKSAQKQLPDLTDIDKIGSQQSFSRLAKNLPVPSYILYL